jgi:hypothetical protein
MVPINWSIGRRTAVYVDKIARYVGDWTMIRHSPHVVQTATLKSYLPWKHSEAEFAPVGPDQVWLGTAASREAENLDLCRPKRLVILRMVSDAWRA